MARFPNTQNFCSLMTLVGDKTIKISLWSVEFRLQNSTDQLQTPLAASTQTARQPLLPRRFCASSSERGVRDTAWRRSLCARALSLRNPTLNYVIDLNSWQAFTFVGAKTIKISLWRVNFRRDRHHCSLLQSSVVYKTSSLQHVENLWRRKGRIILVT